MSRTPLLYPERVRCRTCRRYFGFLVILRAYCSEECAGKPERPIGVENLPRSCRVWRDGVWEAKAVFFTPRSAAKAAKKNKIHWYLCEAEDGCGMYHLSKKTQPWEGTWT
jgi:hypothetical protein